MPYIALDNPVEPMIACDLIASGISRIRSDSNELRSIFRSIGATKITDIVNWFSSDQADIEPVWGYVPAFEQMPCIAVLLEEDNQPDIYIGNTDEYDDDNDAEDSIWNFNKTLLTLIRSEKPAYSYYLYRIVKHIMLVAYDDFVNLGFKNILFKCRPNVLQTEGGAWIFQYEIRMQFLVEEKISNRKTLDEITDATVNQTTYFQVMENPPLDDSHQY